LSAITKLAACGQTFTLADVIADPHNKGIHKHIDNGVRSIVGGLAKYLHVGYALANGATFDQYLAWHKVRTLASVMMASHKTTPGVCLLQNLRLFVLVVHRKDSTSPNHPSTRSSADRSSYIVRRQTL
jgi:hypothetical protein